MASSSRVARALLAGLSLSALAHAEPLYLHVVPIAVEADAQVDFTRPLRLAAYAADPKAIAKALGPAAMAATPDSVRIDLAEYPELAGEPPARYLRPSFVVDYDEPSVAALRAEVRDQHGERPAVPELVAFTRRAIAVKSMERGWDLASQVATRRVGDCTEHAVLLTALARSFSWPARIVLGVVIVSDGEHVAAFGHAWSEIHDGKRWLVADATPIPDEGHASYLPLDFLRDEGPGYGLSIAASLRTTWLRRVEILGNARQERTPAGLR